MTYVAWQVSGLPATRVLGMGGLLDSARFAFAVAEHTGAAIDEIEGLVVGAHGDAMVPLPRFTFIAGSPISKTLPADEVDALVARTISGGAEVVALLKTGSAYYAPGACITRMVYALINDTGETLPACVYLNGKYGIKDTYMSVPAVLGAKGVLSVEELPLDDAEFEAVRASAATISEAIDSLGLRK
jgi:malate dehydrogenase